MPHYPKELKQAIIKRMLPPENTPVQQLVKETGISDCSLYQWRKEAKSKGLIVPGKSKKPEEWSSENKLAVVVETFSMNEAELSAYCRNKGLFVDQVKAWKISCMQANEPAQPKKTNKTNLKEKREIESLKKEIRRKDKALAETAALLVLAKKANAIWGDNEED